VYIKKIIFLITFFLNSNAFASVIALNQDQYLEINFTIQDNNGIFDHDINRFDLIFDYDPSVWSNCCFSERVDIYDGNTLLSSSGPGWYADDVYSNGNLDFTNIRDGSISGQIQIHAWSTNSDDDILLQDFFSWSLGKCDLNLISCIYSENSWVNFGEIKVVSSSVPEPRTVILFSFCLLVLISRKFFSDECINRKQ